MYYQCLQKIISVGLASCCDKVKIEAGLTKRAENPKNRRVEEIAFLGTDGLFCQSPGTAGIYLVSLANAAQMV